MRTQLPLRLPALSLAALLTASPLLAACGGDDTEAGGGGDKTGTALDGGPIGKPETVAGPEEPSATDPGCPFGAKALSKATGLNARAKDSCVFVVKKGSRISVSQEPAAGNESFAETRKTYEEGWQNYAELSVDGYGYAVWSDDELNIAVGYLDNGGEYRFALSNVTPADAGAEDVADLAQTLIDLTVDKRDS